MTLLALLVGCAAAAVASCVPLPAAAAPRVQLPCGAVVHGALLADHEYPAVDAFYSLRYASAKRFAPAVDYRCDADTVVNATVLGDACWATPPTPEGRNYTEDCLTLDVYTRFSRGAHAPVVVWTHGGGNTAGHSTFYAHLSRLAALESVVLVSINYRLGVFGYLAIGELSAELGGTSGNAAIGDHISALRWVQRNIAAFGGDPSRVTMLGQSSGGTNIVALMLAPAATGLFRAAIALSPSLNITASLADTERYHEAFVASALPACAGRGALACLRAAPAAAVASAFAPLGAEPMTLPTMRARGNGWPPLVIVDGSVVTARSTALAAVAAGRPLILSSLAEDVDMVFRLSNESVSNSWSELRAQLDTAMSGDWPRGSATYLLDLNYRTVAARLGARGARATFQSDYMLACARDTLGAPSSTYGVHIAARPSGNGGAGVPMPPMFGGGSSALAFHLWDYMAGFEAFDFFTNIGAKPYTPSADDRALGKALRRSWMSVVLGEQPRDLCSRRSSALADRCVAVYEGGSAVRQLRGSGGGGGGGGGDDNVLQRCDVLGGPMLGLVSPRWWWVN